MWDTVLVTIVSIRKGSKSTCSTQRMILILTQLSTEQIKSLGLSFYTHKMGRSKWFLPTILGYYQNEKQIHPKYTEQWASRVVLVVKNPSAKAGVVRDAGSVPGLRRSLGDGHGNPFQYACLENPMGRGAWRAMVHRVAKSWDTTKVT